MQLPPSPSTLIDWSQVEPESSPTQSRLRQQCFGAVAVKIVELVPGHQAEEWCGTGHTLHCLEGEVGIEVQDRPSVFLRAGQTCHVGDSSDPHRGRSTTGAKLVVVD